MIEFYTTVRVIGRRPGVLPKLDVERVTRIELA
jgi:hypothetical protein